MRDRVPNPSPCRPGVPGKFSQRLGRFTCAPDEVVAAVTGGEGDTDAEILARADVDPDAVLRPEKPLRWLRNRNEWLSNHDIDAVLRQYAGTNPQFEYLGTVPVDFTAPSACGYYGACSTALFQGLWDRRMLGGYVANLDVHTGGGTHWVSLFIDFRDHAAPRAMYYDSTGTAPPRLWKAPGQVWERVRSVVPAGRAKLRFLEDSAYNRKRHQRGNSECGVFSLIALDSLCNGMSFEELCSTDMTDDFALAARDTFFRKPDDGGSRGLLGGAKRGAPGKRGKRTGRRHGR